MGLMMVVEVFGTNLDRRGRNLKKIMVNRCELGRILRVSLLGYQIEALSVLEEANGTRMG